MPMDLVMIYGGSSPGPREGGRGLAKGDRLHQSKEIVHCFFKADIDSFISFSGVWGDSVQHCQQQLTMRCFIWPQSVKKFLPHAILIAHHQRELDTRRTDHPDLIGVGVREGFGIKFCKDTIKVKGVKSSVEGSCFTNMETDL